MAKYRAEYEHSKEVIEIEAPTMKHLYDIARSDFRFAYKHINYRGYGVPYEEVDFFKWSDALGMWMYLGSMFLNITIGENYTSKSIRLGMGGPMVTLKEEWSI